MNATKNGNVKKLKQKKQKLKLKHIPTNVFTCRFNNKTLQANFAYRQKKQWPCVYCSPVEIHAQGISCRDALYVIEMNNERNRVEGIGKIHPSISLVETHCNVHSNVNTNRFIYKGMQYLDRDSLPSELRSYLDEVLFTGKSHSKRGSGITCFPQTFLRDTEKINVNQLVSRLFLDCFQKKL